MSSTWEPYQQPACRAAFIVSSDLNVDTDVSERVGPTFDTARSRLDRLWLDTFADLDLPPEQIAARAASPGPI